LLQESVTGKAVVRLPVHVLTGAHPATNIESLPERTLARLRPSDALKVVRDVHNLRVGGRNLRPGVPTGSVGVVIDSEVSPPRLHLKIERIVSSRFRVPEIVQLTGVLDEAGGVPILVLRELENIHRCCCSIPVLVRLLVDWAGVEGRSVRVIGRHEIIRGRALSCVIVDVEMLFTLSVKSGASEMIPPFAVLFLGHVVSYHV